MAEKILNTRIQLKYDTLANWNASTFLLKRGELAIVEVPTAEGTTLPPVMFKVGAGDKKFSELDWASAKAADVYGWAKKSEAEFKAYIAEYVKTVDLSNYYTKAEIDALLKAITDAASALAGRVTTLEGKYDIDKKLSVIVSEIEGKINAVDTGVMSVTGKDAIAVTSGKNPEVSLKLDASGNVVLSQSSTGLKATIDLSDYALNENIPTEDEIKSAAIAAVEALIKSSDDTNSEVVIENINALVDYVNKNAGDIAQLVTDVATAKSDAATAKSDAADAVSTANTAKATADAAVQTVTAPAGEGIKATRTGNDVVIGFDSNVVFVFDCGNATDKIHE